MPKDKNQAVLEISKAVDSIRGQLQTIEDLMPEIDVKSKIDTHMEDLDDIDQMLVGLRSFVEKHFE
jgi:hypothetical protein